jgi:hypothetical protein
MLGYGSGKHLCLQSIEGSIEGQGYMIIRDECRRLIGNRYEH